MPAKNYFYKKILSLFIIWSLVLGSFVFINLSIFQTASSESGAPPINGTTLVTWYVDGNVVRNNEWINTSNIQINNSATLDWTNITVEVHGNITVNNTGSFNLVNCSVLLNGNLTIFGVVTFQNVTLSMNCIQFNGQYHIEVRTGGEFYIWDYDWDNTTSYDGSFITDSPSDTDDGSNADYAYNFSVGWGAVLEIRNSSLRECGWSSLNDWEQGICVYGDNALFDHVNIINRFKGILTNWANGARITYCNIMINATNSDAIGINGWMGTGLVAYNNTVYMTGTGSNQIGIQVVGANNADIKGNIIYLISSAGWADGISVISGTDNWVVENTVCQFNDGTGILLFSTDAVTAIYNDIRTYANWCSGILIYDTINSLVQDNDVTLWAEGVGISIEYDCQNTLVNSNTIQGNANSVYGIYTSWATNYFTLSDNTINLTGMNSFGLRCEQSSHFDVYGLTVNITNQFSGGVLLWLSHNITLITTDITTGATAGGSHGVWVEHSGDILMGDLVVDLQNHFGAGLELVDGANKTIMSYANIYTTSPTSPALEGINSTDNIFINSTLNAFATDDILLNQNATLILLNTTYSDRTIIGTLTQLIVGWYLHIHVIDELGSDFTNANVQLMHADATEVYSGPTNSNGWKYWMPCLGYIADESTVDNASNPHIINASCATYWDMDQVDLSYGNQILTITLANDEPVITNELASVKVQEDTDGIWDFDASDKENNPLTWSINTTLSWVEFDSSIGKLTLTPTDSEVGNYIFEVKVTDINGGSDKFDVGVNIINRAPKLQTLNVVTATEDTLYSVDYDSDDDPSTTWRLVNGPSWLSIDSNTGVLSGTPNNAHVDSRTINISVEDVHGGITWNNFTLKVDNNSPTILTKALKTATEDQLYKVDYSSSDDGNGTLTWSLKTGPEWLSIDPKTGVLAGRPTNAHVQQWTVNIEVDDGNGGTDHQAFIVTVRNTPPKILTNDVLWIDEDSEYQVDHSCSDDDQGTLVWSLVTDAGDWLEIEPDTGMLTGTPQNENVGAHWVNVTIDDGNGGIDWHNFTLTVNNTNDAPVIITLDVLNAIEDQLYSVNYIADDDDGDTISWALTTEAEWLTLNPSTGALSGTPTNLEVGNWDVTILCDDGNNGTASQTFTVTVINVNDAPIIDYYSPPATYPTIEEGLELEFDITYSDEDSDTFTVIWTLDGLNVREDVPFWTYIPEFDTAGDHEIIVNVTDDGSASVENRWIVIVTATNRAPIIEEFTPMNLKPTLDSGASELTFSVNATDPDDDQMTYEWLVDGIDTGERTSTFNFERSLYGAGTHNLTVIITDDEGIATTQTWNVEVQPSKKDESDDGLLYAILAIIVIVIILIVVFFILLKKRAKIEDIFLISNGGVLLAHKSMELRPDRDEDILSGMLTAIQDFAKDAFTTKSKSGLKRLDFGDSVIHLKRGKGFFIAVVLAGQEPANFESKLDKTIENIESNFGEALARWSGKVSDLDGIKGQLDGVFK